MNEIAQSFPPPGAEQQELPSRSNGKRRRLIAGVLSAVIPGLGHFYPHHGDPAAARPLRGIVLVSLFAASLLAILALRLPGYLAGLVLCVLGMDVLLIVAVWDAAFEDAPRGEKPSQWWLALLLPLALLASAGHLNWSIRVAGFGTLKVLGGSMEPTIREGEHVMVDHRSYLHGGLAAHERRVERGDLVVFS